MSNDACAATSGADDEGCATQCLGSEAATAARASVAPGGREVVTFTCSVSGRDERAVLIGDALASELAAHDSRVNSSGGARVLASLEHSALCACDVATLVGVPRSGVEADLERLADAGLVELAHVDEMPVYRLTDQGRRALDVLAASSAGSVVTMLRLDPSECASCVGDLTAAIGAVNGVGSVSIDPATGGVRVDHDPAVTRDRLETAAAGVGVRVAAPGNDDDGERPWWRQPRSIAFAISAALTVVGLVAGFVFGAETLATALFVVAVPIGGYFPAGAGLRALRRGRITINALLVGALAGALALGLVEEAAILVVIFSLGELLEDYAADKARGSIRALLDLAPKQARLLPDGELVPVEALAPGQVVLVLPGEKLPTDGRVVDGISAVDQSTVTGESLPVEVAPGSDVFAATLNTDGALEIEVTKRYDDTTLARVIDQIRQAQAHKAPSERFVDRFSAIYTPAMFALAIATATIPPLLFGGDARFWFERALVLLVVSCSCALVLSVPVAIVSAISRAARDGILIKGGRYLEALGRIGVVAFDKTGTLTAGKPRVVEVVALNGTTDRDLLAVAAGVEARSDHPLATAIVDHTNNQQIAVLDVSEARTLTGIGAQARINGHTVCVGRASLFDTHETDPNLQALVVAQEQQGRTVVVVGSDHQVIGLIALADEVRPEAAATIERLKRLGIRHIVMLTGDNPITAQAIADQVDIDDYRAALLPEEKTSAIQTLQTTHGPVAMVGDGINDAPAMAQSDIGIAMGVAGSDVALETADLALMADDLSRLPDAIALSHRARTNIGQNIAMSLAVIAALLISAFAGWIDLVSGLILNEAAALLIIANGLRLLHAPTRTT